MTSTDLSLAGLTQSQVNELPLPADLIEALYPLTALQHGLLFHSLQSTRQGAYINQLRVDVEGIDSHRFKAAWRAAFEQHDVLRTGFLYERQPPLQWVARQVALPLVELDWSETPESASRLDRLAASELERPFDLAHPPLVRLVLIRTQSNRYHFIWTHHHVLMDGWSLAQLTADVLRRYQQHQAEAPRSRYIEYIRWLQGRDASVSEAFWKRQLQRLEEPTRLSEAFLAKGTDERFPRAHGSLGSRPRCASGESRARAAGDAQHRGAGGLGMADQLLHRPAIGCVRRDHVWTAGRPAEHRASGGFVHEHLTGDRDV